MYFKFSVCFIGTGESGKSTFIKQMRIIHGTGFNSDDLMMFRKIIKKNILSSIKTIINAMDVLFLEYENEVCS